MGKILTSDLRSDMVLANAVLDHKGSVILKKKSPITKKNLKILKMWGITEVDVEDVEREEVIAQSRSKMDPVILNNVESKAMKLFQRANTDHPVIKELMHQYIIRSAKAHSEKEEPNAAS